MFGTGCIIRKNADNFSVLGDLKGMLTSGTCLLKDTKVCNVAVFGDRGESRHDSVSEDRLPT